MKESKRPLTTPTEIIELCVRINNASEKVRNIIYGELEAQKVALMRKGIEPGTGNRLNK